MPEPEALNVLRDLAVVMMVAGGVILVFHWLRQPVILGYIIAGVIIGPFTPPFPLIRDVSIVNLLAELGIILLMFSLGLEFSLKKLRQVGKIAIIGGAIQVLIVFTLGYQAGLLLGWGPLNAIFLGAGLSISSTALIVKVLEEQRRMAEESSQAAFGILVFEDFAAIAMIAILSGLGDDRSIDLGAVGPVLLKLSVFSVISVLLGITLVPRLMDHLVGTGRRELFVVVGLGLCFGLAHLADTWGLSVAAGAFIAGALVAEAKHSEVFSHTVAPVKDMFAAVFFVAIGMLLDPRVLVQYWPQVLLLTLVLVVGKILAGTVATFLLGYHHHTAIQVGMKLAQIGEFSLIIMKVGQDDGAIAPFLYPVVVGITALSTLTTPYLIGFSAHAGERVDRALPRPFLRYLRTAERALRVLQFQAGAPSSPGRILRRQITGIVINLVLVAGFILLGRLAYESREIIAGITHASPWVVTLVVGLLALVSASVPLMATVHYVRALAATGAESLAGQRGLGIMLTRPVIRTVLQNTVTIILLLVMAMLLNLMLPPITTVPYLPILIIASALLLIFYCVWDLVQAFHRRVEDLLRERLLGEAPARDRDQQED